MNSYVVLPAGLMDQSLITRDERMSAGGKECWSRLQDPKKPRQQTAKCNANTLFDPE